MDGDGVVIGIEHDDFEQAPGGISADHQDPVVALPYDAERDRDRCQDLLVGDSVPPGALRNLHYDRLPCQALYVGPLRAGSRSSTGAEPAGSAVIGLGDQVHDGGRTADPERRSRAKGLDLVAASHSRRRQALGAAAAVSVVVSCNHNSDWLTRGIRSIHSRLTPNSNPTDSGPDSKGLSISHRPTVSR